MFIENYKKKLRYTSPMQRSNLKRKSIRVQQYDSKDLLSNMKAEGCTRSRICIFRVVTFSFVCGDDLNQPSTFRKHF